MEDYYLSHTGSGIVPYSGYRYQKGAGFFGSFIKGKLLPILKSVLPYLGRTVLDASSNFAENLNSGDSFKQAAKRTLKRTGLKMADDGLAKLKQQAGMGVRRRKRKQALNAFLAKLRKPRCKTIKAKKTKKRKAKQTRRRRKPRKALTLF